MFKKKALTLLLAISSISLSSCAIFKQMFPNNQGEEEESQPDTSDDREKINGGELAAEFMKYFYCEPEKNIKTTVLNEDGSRAKISSDGDEYSAKYIGIAGFNEKAKTADPKKLIFYENNSFATYGIYPRLIVGDESVYAGIYNLANTDISKMPLGYMPYIEYNGKFYTSVGYLNGESYSPSEQLYHTFVSENHILFGFPYETYRPEEEIYIFEHLSKYGYISWFIECQPMRWKVLEYNQDAEYAILYADEVIDYLSYDYLMNTDAYFNNYGMARTDEAFYNDYAYSGLRNGLKKIYQTMFQFHDGNILKNKWDYQQAYYGEEEEILIREAYVEDFISVPSRTEYQKMMNKFQNFTMYTTEYVRTLHRDQVYQSEVNPFSSGSYYLRDATYDQYNIYTVDNGVGTREVEGYKLTRFGVVPIIKVSLKGAEVVVNEK